MIEANERLYNQKRNYEKKRRIKTVSFNLETEGDLLAFVENLPDFSKWVKDKANEEIKKTA